MDMLDADDPLEPRLLRISICSMPGIEREARQLLRCYPTKLHIQQSLREETRYHSGTSGM